MKKKIMIAAAAVMIMMIAVAVNAQVIRDAIWADGALYGVTLTPNDVPMKGPFDVLYNFGNSGLTGQRSVSETKPGDRDYNGGRWEVVPVTFTPSGMLIFDPDEDGAVNFEMTSDQEIMDQAALGYLTIGSPIRYFVCPLHPQK